MLRWIHYLLCVALRFSRLHPRIVVAFVLSFTLLTSLGLTKLQFLLSIDDLIDPDFQTYESLKKVNSEFKDKNTVLLSLESEKPLSKDFLCHLQKWVIRASETQRDLIQIQSTFGITQGKVENNQFYMNSFLDLNCDSKEPETEKILTAFEQIKKSPWNGILLAKSGYSITVNFIIYDPQDTRFGSIDPTIVDKLQESFDIFFKTNSSALEGVSVYWGGITTYQSYLRKAFDQTQFLNGLMFVLSLLIFRLFLGSWKAGLLFNFTITLSSIVIFGLMGHLGIPVDVLTNSTGLIMIVSCLEDFVFLVYGMLKFKWSFQKAMRKFLLPAFFTSLTTTIGFGSLVTSDLSTIKRFGLLSSFAGMYEWAIIFLFLPSLFKILPKWQNLDFKVKKINLNWKFENRLSRRVCFTLCSLLLIPVLFHTKLTVKDTPESFFFKGHTVSQTTQHFKETRGWVTEVSLLFNKDNSEVENKELIEKAKNIKTVEYIEDFYTVGAYLTEPLDAPDKRLISNFWESSIFSRRLLSRDGQNRAQIFINSLEMDDIKAMTKEFDSICQNGKCVLAGSIISYNEFSVRILNTLFSSLGLSIILVAIIIFLIRKPLSMKQTFALILSSIWGPLMLLGMFIIFKVPLTFVTCICASLLVGLAGDNAIQFIFNAKKNPLDKSIDTLSEASFIIMIGMMTLISVFLLSEIASLAFLGISILAGFVFGFIGDVWLLKGLLKK